MVDLVDYLGQLGWSWKTIMTKLGGIHGLTRDHGLYKTFQYANLVIKKNVVLLLMLITEISKEQHLYEIEFISNILNVFTITFNKCNVSLLN